MLPHNRMLSALSLALYAGISLASSSAARAATEPHPFVLIAYGAGPGGADLLAGRYPAALQQLRARAAAQGDPSAVNANRCVALAMTQHWQDAHATCDAAVHSAADQRLAAEPWSASSTCSADRALAAAYADRAVLRWLSDDPSGARADLAKAQALAPQAGFVINDLSALRSHSPEEHARGS